ncbi:MAG: hypothetical protein ACR5LF_12535 [Symbiopectobacterium sp.]
MWPSLCHLVLIVSHAAVFAAHLDVTGIQHSQSIPGNFWAAVKRVTQGDWEHFFLATYWQDIEAIKAFAGKDYHVAVTYPDDEQFGLLSDPYIFQHEVEFALPL